jgi:hypothetical protein
VTRVSRSSRLNRARSVRIFLAPAKAALVEGHAPIDCPAWLAYLTRLSCAHHRLECFDQAHRAPGDPFAYRPCLDLGRLS